MDAREKKLHYIQTRNDLEFARRNPLFFDNLPTADMLANAGAIYTRLLNAVMDHAIRISRGQISPPRIFDPAALTPPLVEPAPIPLVRTTPSAIPTIRVPNMVGLDSFLLEGMQRILPFSSVDDAMAGTGGFEGPDGEHRPIGVSREIVEFIKLTLDGGPRLTTEPKEPSVSPSTEAIAQFPSAGALVTRDSEVILQFAQ
jgi:hypothetical protein